MCDFLVGDILGLESGCVFLIERMNMLFPLCVWVTRLIGVVDSWILLIGRRVKLWFNVIYFYHPSFTMFLLLFLHHKFLWL